MERVTNEQIRCFLAGCSGWCPDCQYKDIKPKCTFVMSDAYEDLLDARELNDKQEALIKEMRGIVSTLWHDGCAEDYRKCCAILEKTKDYA